MQPSSGNFRLIVRRGPQPNQVHEINKDIITVGRDITNDITINDPEVSRHHARLTRGGGGYTIEDLGSTNGSFINGQRLTGPRPLSPGDMVGLGETVTLAYEAAGMEMGVQTAVSGAPSAPDPYQGAYSAPPAAASPYAPPPAASPYAPPPGQAPYAPPPAASPYAPPPGQAPYAPPPQTPYGVPPQAPYGQPPMAGYGEQPAPYGTYEEPERSGWGRFLLLGCGCFIVLCVIGAVVALIIIDQTCAWRHEPLAGLLDLLGVQANQGLQACQ